METIELIKQLALMTAYFKAAVTLAIALGTGCGAFFALWRHSERENEQLRDCLDEAHREANEAQKGHMIALATLAEERGNGGTWQCLDPSRDCTHSTPKAMGRVHSLFVPNR